MQKSRITAIALVLTGALGLAALATRVDASGAAQVVSSATTPLEGTFWQAVLVGDRQVRLFGVYGPYLVFERTGRVSGSDGCSRFEGDFDVNEEAVTFARIETTHSMCVARHDVARIFGQALNNTRRLSIVGNQLELLDAGNRPLVILRPAL